jgi:hypothetical protein
LKRNDHLPDRASLSLFFAASANFEGPIPRNLFVNFDNFSGNWELSADAHPNSAKQNGGRPWRSISAIALLSHRGRSIW